MLTYEQYKKDLEITKQLLDLIDIEIYLEPGTDIRDIMDTIEDDVYGTLEEGSVLATNEPEIKQFLEEHFSVFQDYVFNVMDSEEFLQYCKNRYHQYLWHTEVIERTYIYGVKNNE